ncbi:hypothetical protein SDC9_142177 [bioreactor metagenome]|uniref:Uncharacterized protein n=1 Tax=bioreactor metagenome TaxID=1076179 RepID=A0A645E0C5_9ZZZZ
MYFPDLLKSISPVTSTFLVMSPSSTSIALNSSFIFIGSPILVAIDSGIVKLGLELLVVNLASPHIV